MSSFLIKLLSVSLLGYTVVGALAGPREIPAETTAFLVGGAGAKCQNLTADCQTGNPACTDRYDTCRDNAPTGDENKTCQTAVASNGQPLPKQCKTASCPQYPEGIQPKRCR
jgi:hypothetical protein